MAIVRVQFRIVCAASAEDQNGKKIPTRAAGDSTGSGNIGKLILMDDFKATLAVLV